MNILDQPSVNFRPAAFLSGSPGPWASHLPFAYDLVAALKPQTIVSLGVSFGDSYFGFCQAVAENVVSCTCYGVDKWPDDVYETVRKHNDRLYRSFSYLLRRTFDEALGQFSGESIGLLHLDGFQTYEAVQDAFEEWIPKVRPGGVVLLHDVAVRSGDYGTWQLWEELQSRFAVFTFRNGNGLGVLWKADSAGQTNTYLRELFSSSAENQERIRRYYSLCAERLELAQIVGAGRTVAKRAQEPDADSVQAMQALVVEHEKVKHDLETRLAQAEEQIDRQRKLHLATAGERERIQATHGLLTQELAIAKGNVEELKAEIERLSTIHAQSHSELVESKKVAARMTAALEQERMLRAMMENSRAWRFTKPLRKLAALFRRGSRG
jgi:Methyltransferase domain